MPGGNPASLVKIRLSVAASSSFFFFSTVIAHKRRVEGGSHKTGEGKEKKREKLKPPRKNNYMWTIGSVHPPPLGESKVMPWNTTSFFSSKNMLRERGMDMKKVKKNANEYFFAYSIFPARAIFR